MNNKKKVCHITSVHSRYDGRIFKRDCCSLSKAGYDVVLLVGDGLEKEVNKGVTITSIKCNKNRIKRVLTSAKLMFKPAVEIQADIYQIHDPELLPLARKLCKKGKHVIYDSHEFYYYQIKQKNYLPKFFRGLIAAVYKIYEKWVLSSIDAVITPCTVNGQNYFESIAKKVVFIDNRPSCDLIKAIPYEDKKLPLKCCYTGSLTKERGIVEMLNATNNTNTNFLLAGVFDPRLEEELQEQLDYSNLDFRGFVDFDGVQQIYDESHIGLSVLHNTFQYGMIDNLPTKVYEYMLAGIPVVLSKRAYTEQFIKKYPIGILVDPENIDEIQKAIIYLRDNPQEAKQMGLIGRKAVIEELCWEKEVEKLFDLYNTIIM